MEYIIDTENITLDYSESRKDKSLYEYRITVFDDNGHYSDEIYLSDSHLLDLVDELQKITNSLKRNEFE